MTSVCNKLHRIDTQTSWAADNQSTAKQFGGPMHALNGTHEPWLAGYRGMVLNGVFIEATHHRIEH